MAGREGNEVALREVRMIQYAGTASLGGEKGRRERQRTAFEVERIFEKSRIYGREVRRDSIEVRRLGAGSGTFVGAGTIRGVP